MDVKDLMVGDVVLCPDGADLITVKVMNIDGQGETVRVQRVDGHSFGVMAESLRPSPLNANILRSIDLEEDEFTKSPFCVIFKVKRK